MAFQSYSSRVIAFFSSSYFFFFLPQEPYLPRDTRVIIECRVMWAEEWEDEKSRWKKKGGYEPISPVLHRGINYQKIKRNRVCECDESNEPFSFTFFFFNLSSFFQRDCLDKNPGNFQRLFCWWMPERHFFLGEWKKRRSFFGIKLNSAVVTTPEVQFFLWGPFFSHWNRKILLQSSPGE